MTWNEIIFAIGDLVSMTFELLKLGENKVNWLYIVIITFVLVAWIFKQIQYNKEAERTGGYK